MVEDLTDALQYNEAVFEYQGPDIRIPHEGFSTDEEKIEFCKRLEREREGIKKECNRILQKNKGHSSTFFNCSYHREQIRKYQNYFQILGQVSFGFEWIYSSKATK